MINPEVIVERLETYTRQDAEDLGLLRNALSSKRSGSRLSRKRIDDIVGHPDRLFVAARAVETGRIVGCETLVTQPVPEWEDDDPPGIGHLGFVATHIDYRGHGIVKRVTVEGLNWCTEQGLEDIRFTSNSHNPERDSARGFYIKYGAVIIAEGVEDEETGAFNTDLFNWKVQDGLAALSANS